MREFFLFRLCNVQSTPKACISTASINVDDIVQIRYGIQVQQKFYTPGHTEDIGCKTTLGFHRTHNQHEASEGVCVWFYQPTSEKKKNSTSVPVAIYVSPPVLRIARHASISVITIGTIDKSNTITRLR